jgi:excisionase family DNA binding protein
MTTEPRTPPSVEILTVEEVASRCKLNPKTIKRAIDRGELKASQLATRGGWRVIETDMWAWLELRANTTRRPTNTSVTFKPIDPDPDVTLPRRMRAHRSDGRVVVPATRTGSLE